MIIIWTKNENGEYNEHSTKTKNGIFILFSDRTESIWTVEFPNGHQMDLESTDLQSAKQEVEKEIKTYNF